jgi:hypothetical protein
MAEMPEFMAEKGMAVGRIYTEDVIKAANAAAHERFGINDVAKRFFRPYLYLNDEVIMEAKLDHSAVEQAVADALRRAAAQIDPSDASGPLLNQTAVSPE